MIRMITLAALVLTHLLPAEGQSRTFPYQAVITENETYVRSGPGSRYYPTARLSEGVNVTVHRHDPGGWYMIAPPAGSFSWIRAEYIETSDRKTGTVNDNQVVVRVGSLFGDKKDVEQKRLSRGDRVNILGEKSFNTPEGLVHMYKISPPRGEYRWVPGQFLAAADSIAKRPPAGNPFEEIKTPTVAKKTEPEVDPFSTPNKPGAKKSNNPGVVRTDKPQATQSEAQQLAQLDEQFRQTIRSKTSQWDLSPIETGYQKLAESASTDALKDQLDQRFAALAKYQKIKDQYDDFLRLTEETANRDAQILSDTGMRPDIVAPPKSVPPVEKSSEPAETRKPTISNDPAKMSGAGLIQRAVVAAPNSPNFVLISPTGEVLAYLSSTSINLGTHLGKPRGIFGKRSYRTDLQADFIEVEGVTPVRLKR
ncbi:MAG: SH3 domain-containing protein [Planctomycetaceae bacterium]|jgi:uncharacterized protein YgiM (DUF1202 family)|nr:SH3 domain-containing protein [bacterium]MDB4679759.1 SH3 domain-containing protein [Planctomycetaceae bacterium]MDC0307583.1 SH3 domain-containing protein [Planctomycetaceae bacterium]MDG2390436.1 SH3 domain-containing protein [Planctomycetaceae bacterium]